MENISKLLQLEHNCRNCESIKELYYQIVNETRTLVNYSQGVLLTIDFSGKYKVVGISDISVVDSTSPYVQWIENIIIDLNNKKEIINQLVVLLARVKYNTLKRLYVYLIYEKFENYCRIS